MIKEELIRNRMMCDARGKISTGMKSPKGYPMSTDYFVCDAFKEITGLYGDKPTKLIIYMPSDDLYDFFDCNFQQYRSDKQKVRQCDGETCRHILDETVNVNPKEGETELRSKKFEQGQVTVCICNYMPETVPNVKKPGEMMKNPQLCSYGMSLKALVANPMTLRPMSPQPIMFRSGSKNTGDTIFTELKRYTRFRNIPFELEVQLVRVGGNKFPVWKIRPYIDFESNLAYQLEGAPVDTGLRALPPPLAQVEADTFNQQGNFTNSEVVKGEMVVDGLSPASGVSKVSPSAQNVSDAVYAEVFSGGGVIDEKPADNDIEEELRWIRKSIFMCKDVKELNEYWLRVADKVKSFPPKDGKELREYRDAKKLELKGEKLPEGSPF